MELEEQLYENGYASRSSLAGLDDVQEVMADMQVPRGVAKQLVAQAGALAVASGATRRLDLGGASAPQDSWPSFEGKLVVAEVGGNLAMPRSRLEVDT